MKPHKHAELIKAWADGAKIERYSSVTEMWVDAENPFWTVNEQYRIKPDPKWYDNIPEHGLLCYVADTTDCLRITRNIRVVYRYSEEDSFPFYTTTKAKWKYALPLTNDEIKQFLLPE